MSSNREKVNWEGPRNLQGWELHSQIMKTYGRRNVPEASRPE